jgi:O-antigen ligase/polysaccharide polymerase Wzy-like membrane protein
LPPLDSRSRAAELLPLVPAAAIPLLFLHVRYQANTSFGPIDVFGSDIEVAATVAAALVAGAWWGFAPLRRPRTLWAVAGALLTLYVASCFWTPLDHPTKHLITAAKIGEYALLAPAVVLLLRRRRDVDRFLFVFVGWSVAASGWGLLQFLGLVDEFSGKRPGQREVSFLGIHDFAAFSAATLAVGLAGIALGERQRIVWVAAAAGAVGSVLAASVFAFSGIVLAVILAAEVGRRAGMLTVRRAWALAAITVAVAGGVFELRAGDVTNFLSFLGHAKPTAAQSQDIQTGAHRVVLAYIGLRIWEDHPLLGVGFERSTTQYGPYVAAAKRKYPHEAPSSFPSPQHEWGVQNLWVQTLADEGIVGLVLLLSTFAAGLVLALRALRQSRLLALIAAGWILVAAGTWNANGILAGLPLDALTWFGFGLAATVSGLEG